MSSISSANAYNSVSNYTRPTNVAVANAPVKTSSYNPFGGDKVSLLLDNSDNLANYIASGYNANKQGAGVADAFKKLGTDFSGSLSSTLTAGLSGAGIGALAMGAARGWEEAVHMSQGRTTIGRATGGIVGSTIQGAAGGFGSVLSGGLSNLVAAGIGLGGVPLAVATIIGGAVGGALASKLVNTCSIEAKIARAIDN